MTDVSGQRSDPSIATLDDGPQSEIRRIWRGFRRHRLAMFGLFVILVLIFMAIFADQITYWDVKERDRDNRDSPPSLLHPLGTDRLGFDVWSNLVYSTRVSLTVGLVAGLLMVTMGTTIGLLSGFLGGWVDGVLMRFTDAIIAVPGLVLILAAIAILGPSLSNIVVVIGLTSWPGVARIIRSQVLSLRNWEFIIAARAMGAPARRIVLRHLLPNVLASIIVALTIVIPVGILSEAGLSFLGLGDPTLPSWGRMMNAAQSHVILRTRPWLWAPPGIAISLCTLSINFIGDGLRDAFDPYTPRR